MSDSLVYDADYQETLTLRDGQRVRLRTVRPDDKHHLVEGLDRLSPASRLARFMAIKKRLSDAELAYLTELDHVDHFAIGVVLLAADGTEGEGVAIGRFIRMPDEPDTAEPAIVVVDAWQGHGLGRVLLERLRAAARERGIRFFRAEFLAENEAIRRLLESMCPQLQLQRRGSVIVSTMPLDAAVAAPGGAASGELLHRLLRLAAQRLLHLRSRH